MTEVETTGVRRGAWLVNHPWVALLIFLVVLMVLLQLIGVLLVVAGLPPANRVLWPVVNVLLLFVVTPYLLGLPKGRVGMVAYLDDTRLSRIKPVVPLVLLGISCWVILALCQGLGTIIFRLTEGKELSLVFLAGVWDLSTALPPQSGSLWESLPSVFEELAFRGVVLTLFLNRYRRNASILISSAAFAMLHLLNLMGPQDPVWVLGQVGWAFLMGVMYGYLFIKADSLLPGMILHYLGNVFVGSIMAYLNANSTIGVQVLYGVITTFGLVPVALVIAWIRFFSRRWLVRMQ